MSKSINEQATNKVSVIGKLLDCSFREGTIKSSGQRYESANYTIRVTQTYNGHEETSEIPMSTFGTPSTSTGKPNPAYATVQALKNMKTVQDVGEADATRVRITSGRIRENNYVAKSGNLVNMWVLDSSFVNEGNRASDIASFNVDIFIMDMHDEVDNEGDPTGRLIVKGGIVQFGGRLDVVEFIVEDNDAVDYISRNWNVNDTVNAGGRIRFTSKEVQRSATTSSWGEELPETSTRVSRELIITRGSDEPFEEEFAYDAADIKKAFNIRKAAIEQLQNEAVSKPAPAPAATTSKYSWE